ncbi:MAG: hypothetical protein Q9217_003672 [Psora testacea]
MDPQCQYSEDRYFHSTEHGSFSSSPPAVEDNRFGDSWLEGQEPSDLTLDLPTYWTACQLATPPALQLPSAVPPPHPASPALTRQLDWWEVEVRQILCSQNLLLIQLLLRFRLYGEESFLLHLLQHVWTFRLDEILTLLMDGAQVIAKKDRKVNKILELVDSDRAPPSIGSNWEPRDTTAIDAEQIATGIERESRSLFTNIRVEDCLKHAMGWMEESIEHLFVQHRCFSFKIRCYLRECPTQRVKFIHVEEKLRNRSPLAHQAVLNGLLPPGYPAHFNLEPICEPLRTFAEDDTISLGAILTRLPILAERFDYTYKQAPPTTWPRFRTEVDTFTALISTLAMEYAREMTISDVKDFDLLCPNVLKASGSQSVHLLKNWYSFRDAIAECCKAYPHMNYRVNEIAHMRIAHG